MTDEKIARINKLARKSKVARLTPEEVEEQAMLRREYIDSYKQSLTAQLNNTYIEDENGNRVKAKKKP